MSTHQQHHQLQRQQQHRQPRQHRRHGSNHGMRSSSVARVQSQLPGTSNKLGEPQNFVWSKVSIHPQSTIPPPRSGAASVVVRGKLYMFGGYGGGTGRLDDFYSFDFDTLRWEEVEVVGTPRPGCRENNGVVISDSSRSIYLFGGYDGTSWLNDLWQYDIESKQWTCVQESSDSSTSTSSTSASTSNSISVSTSTSTSSNPSAPVQAVPGDGSVSASRDGNGDAAGAAISAVTATISVQGKVPSRRFGYVSVVHNNKLVLFGGFDGNRWCNDMYVFDFETRQWSEIDAKGELPSVRSCPAWAKDDTHVYIQGGYDGVERKDDFFACDLSTYAWKQMPNLGTVPSPRYFHSCSLYGNKMYLYGGYSGCERLDDMYAYDFETSHWSEIFCRHEDAPSGRSSLVAQIYGSDMYIFGGYNGNNVLNDFYKFRLKPIAIPPSALVNDFRRLLNQPEMSDVRFLVDGQEVHAHRSILAVRSEYFRVLLFNGMRESVQSSQTSVAAGIGGDRGSGAISLPDVSHEVFLRVLEFIYTDTVVDVSLDLGIHLLVASEHFLLDRLKALCEDVIRREITAENVISILITSHQYTATGLKDTALDFILENLGDNKINIGLDELKSEPDLLVEIIRLQTLQLEVFINANRDGIEAEGGGADGGPGMQSLPLDTSVLDPNQQLRRQPNDLFGPAAEWRGE